MQSAFTHTVLLTVAAADQARANAAATQLPNAKPADNQVFEIGLCPAGSPDGTPPTHYWANGAFQEASFQALQGLIPAFPTARVLEYDPLADPDFPARTLAVLGLQRCRARMGG